jgi:hypothetical protein
LLPCVDIDWKPEFALVCEEALPLRFCKLVYIEDLDFAEGDDADSPSVLINCRGSEAEEKRNRNRMYVTLDIVVV